MRIINLISFLTINKQEAFTKQFIFVACDIIDDYLYLSEDPI